MSTVEERVQNCKSLQDINDIIVQECTVEKKIYSRMYWSPEFAADLIVDEALTRIRRNPAQVVRWIQKGRKRILKVSELTESGAGSKGITADTVSGSKFSIEELKKLKQALDEGLITNEEFEAAKKRLLNI